MNFKELENKAAFLSQLNQCADLIVSKSGSIYRNSNTLLRAIRRIKYLALTTQSFNDDKHRYYLYTVVCLMSEGSHLYYGEDIKHKQRLTRKQYKVKLATL